MKKYIIFDTETTNSLDDPIFFDIGWAVIDAEGSVYETASYVNADVFLDDELMASAYYAEKIPQYWAEIKNGSRILAKTKTIKKALAKACRDWEVDTLIAHNARFDYNALNKTQRWVTKSKYRYFLPYGVEIWDTMKMARDVIGNMLTYRKFCEENGFLTKTGRLSMTAENLYRFISKDVDFIESHTGLEDVEIELEILKYCFRQHKKMRKKLWEN